MNIRMKKYQGFLVALLFLTLVVFNACSDEKTSEQQPIILPNAEGYELRVLGIGQWAGQIEASNKTIELDCDALKCSFSGKQLPDTAYEISGRNVVLKFGLEEKISCKTPEDPTSTKFACPVGFGGAHATEITWDKIRQEEITKLRDGNPGINDSKLNLIRVSTGDNFGISSDVAARMNDVPTISLLNKLKLNYDTFGNHNLEKGIAYLQNLITLSKHSYVVANLTNVPQNLQKVAPYAMRYIHSDEKDSTPLLLAVVGTVDHSATNMIFSGSLGTVDIADYCATKYAMQDAYSNGARAFLLIAHLAVDQNNVDHQTLYHFSKMLLEMKDEKFQICPQRFGYEQTQEIKINKAIYQSVVAVIGASAWSDSAFLINSKKVGELLTTNNSVAEMLRKNIEECRIYNALKEPIDIEASWGKPYKWPDVCYNDEQNTLSKAYNICSNNEADNKEAKGNCSQWYMYHGILSENELVENIKIDNQALKGLYDGISKNVVTELTASALKVCKKPGFELDPDPTINAEKCNARAKNNFLLPDAQDLKIIHEVYEELKAPNAVEAKVSFLESTLSAGLDLLVSSAKIYKPCDGIANPITDGFCTSDMGNNTGNAEGFVFIQVTEKGQLLYDIQAKLKKDGETNDYVNNGLMIDFKKPYGKANVELLPSTCNITLEKLDNCMAFYNYYIKNRTSALPNDTELAYIKACFKELNDKSVEETVTAWQCLFASTTSSICPDADRKMDIFKEPIIFKFLKDAPSNEPDWDVLPYSQQAIRNQTTMLGNLVCDAVIGYYEKENIDIFLINSGAVRQGLKGNLRVSSANSVCPYSNSIVVMKLTSKEIAQVIEHGLKFAASTDHGGYLQVGGMRYTYNINALGDKLKHIDLIHYVNKTESSYTTIYDSDITKCPSKASCNDEKQPCLLQGGDGTYCYYFDPTKATGSGESGQTYVLASLDYLYTGGDGFVFPKVPAIILDLYSVALVGYFRGKNTTLGCDDASSYVTSDGLNEEELLIRLAEKRACKSVGSCESWDSP